MTLAVSALVAGRDPAVEALELAEAVAHEIGPDPVLAPQQSPGLFDVGLSGELGDPRFISRSQHDELGMRPVGGLGAGAHEFTAAVREELELGVDVVCA
jgi:hypothetical protein